MSDADKDVLKHVKILSINVEQVTDSHKTPWLHIWTLHNIEIPEENAEMIASDLSQALEKGHNWYADFKDETHHYIIFRDKVFHVQRI